MYMIGQLAALRDRTCTIAELHRTVAVDSARRIESLTPVEPRRASEQEARPSRIAIVGMSCILPKARDLRSYWENILNKISGISEIPPSRWDSALYFDADRSAPDKIYSKWGGFLDEELFDPLEFGMPPSSLASSSGPSIGRAPR
jgi:hypothetical protein